MFLLRNLLEVIGEFELATFQDTLLETYSKYYTENLRKHEEDKSIVMQ